MLPQQRVVLTVGSGGHGEDKVAGINRPVVFATNILILTDRTKNYV